MKVVITFILLQLSTFLVAQDTISSTKLQRSYIDGKEFTMYNNQLFTGVSVDTALITKNTRRNYVYSKEKTTNGSDTLIKIPTDSIVNIVNYCQGLKYGTYFTYDLYYGGISIKGFNNHDGSQKYVYHYFPKTGNIQMKKVTRGKTTKRKHFDGKGRLMEKEIIKPNSIRRMKKEVLNKDMDDELEIVSKTRTRTKIYHPYDS
jgi:hypothetical protein